MSDDGIVQTTYRTWEVESSTSRKKEPYSVWIEPKDGKLHCNCEGFAYRKTCNHVKRVQAKTGLSDVL